MTRSEAMGTGLSAGTTTGTGSCGGSGDGFLGGAPAPGGPNLYGQLFFSASTGRLVAIYAYPGVQTPQGVELGSSFAQMHAAYPDWNPVPVPGSSTDGRGGVKVPGNPNAHFRIVVAAGTVVQLSLDDNHQDCYE
jgi:hypothetical protein